MSRKAFPRETVRDLRQRLSVNQVKSYEKLSFSLASTCSEAGDFKLFHHHIRAQAYSTTVCP